MKKTLFILIVVALLGILAAAIAPGSNSKSTANTSSTTATQTATTPTATTATTPAASSSTTTTPAASTTSSSQYKDGSYTGTVATNYYDEIQVAVVISNGKITAITTPTLTGDSGHSNQSLSLQSKLSPPKAVQLTVYPVQAIQPNRTSAHFNLPSIKQRRSSAKSRDDYGDAY